MAPDAINVLIRLNVHFSIRQKQDFSHSVIPFPPTSQIRIEPNRCAMACQGCGAVFLFLHKKAVEIKSYK